MAKVWNLKDNFLANFDTHEDGVTSAVFSPYSQQILTASEDGTAKVLNMVGRPLLDLKHGETVFFAVFSPNGGQIITAS